MTLAFTPVFAAEGDAPATPKPAPAPKTLPPASTKTGLTFDKDVKPLFAASCIKCHGEQKPKGGLNLTTHDTTLVGGEDGKVIEVGNSAKSSLVTAIARINPKTAMPPEPRAPRRAVPGAPAGEKRPEKVADAGHAADAPAAAAEKPKRPAGAQGGQGGEVRPGGPGAGGPGGRNQGPPPKPLTAEEVGIVRAWIDQGAK